VPFLSSLDTYRDVDAALEAPAIFVPEGAEWRFRRGRDEPSPGLEWTEAGFDDGLWERGPSGFGGRPNDGLITTPLPDQLGSYTTLYLRHAFSLNEAPKVEKLLFSLSYEDGFIAYLNGREIARRYAGKPGERLAASSLATRFKLGVRHEALVPVDAAWLRSGENVLAVQVLAYGLDSYVLALPVLAACLDTEEAWDRGRTRCLRKGADGTPDPALAAYREGRILERGGKREEAVQVFERLAALDPISPEPCLRLLRGLQWLGEFARAEALARERLERGALLDDVGVWRAWLETMVQGLKKPLPEVLASWPAAPGAGSGGHGAALRSVVEDLAANRRLRIDCGSAEASTVDGKAWKADRFFLGGWTPMAVAGTTGKDSPEEAEGSLHRSLRSFPGPRQIRPAYSVPLLPGRYRVHLHAAERTEARRGARIFTVLLEGRSVLDSWQPLSQGTAPFESRSFEVDIRDGFLDLDFLAEEDEPALSALEIERLED
jgi:tetratricopeptide (TPR) repeat protein